MISPSMRSAVAQSLQLPGFLGTEHNCVLTEFSLADGVDGADALGEMMDTCEMAAAAGVNSLVLRNGQHFFGQRATIHVWLTWHDYRNANLMILLSYILLGHPDWRDAEIRIFTAYPHEQVEERRTERLAMITSGRLPVSRRNLVVFPSDEQSNFGHLVEVTSAQADLVLFGFTIDRLHTRGADLFQRHKALGDVLFISAQEQVLIE
ncbi:MAG TPA: hypothetical protein VGA37_13455 [Gemmatimonadales bacterium]